MNRLKIITYWNPVTGKFNAEVPERPSLAPSEADTRNAACDAAVAAADAIDMPPTNA